ncbi:MAG TPA: hypothetical protein VKR80_02505 [Candidatus Limnocylindria bacterium]|nr:hypothetical protein [Candidatus Limnocylindria bacterium]
MKAWVALGVVAIALGAAVVPAQAHDPAEAPLRTGTAFLPFVADSEQAFRFLDLIRTANRAGFPIRAALIGRSRDLDEYASYWRKPRVYARLLGGELAPVYKQRLLVVMPNGFGFSWLGHSTAAEYTLLQRIAIGAGTDGMLIAAQTAVVRLAAAAGLTVRPPAKVTTPAERTAHDRLVIILASLAAAGVAVVVRFLVRRRAQGT